MSPPTTALRRSRPEWTGLVVLVILVAAAIAVPRLLDWQVHSHGHPSSRDVAPLHSLWRPALGPGTVPALVLAVLGARYAIPLAHRLPWRGLLLASYTGALAWLLALAYVDGPSGLSRVLGNPYEYLPTARSVTDVPAMLGEFVDRIPYSASDNWVTHVAGHPPGALLFFVLLDRLGLGGDWTAGLVVTVLAASTAPAVLTALRALGAEQAARRAAPFLVLGPAAVWTAVSADALFAATAAWGLAALALAGTSTGRGWIGWSTLAGVLLGACVMFSYGLPLLGLLALAVLVVARSWRPLPVAAVAACVVVGAFALAGFAWWEALPVLRERYWDGIARVRPPEYWMWGNLAALGLCAGPALGAALGRFAVDGRRHRVVVWLVGAAVLTVLAADLSQMSKAEVERIWLPFVPWLLVATAVLSEHWRRGTLTLQVAAALVVQHLLYTSW